MKSTLLLTFGPTVTSPSTRQVQDEQDLPGLPGDSDGPWVVILYNDDWHPFDEVVVAIASATGYPYDRAEAITLEAHLRGRAIAYTGARPECDRVAGLLRSIRLQVETDLF